MGEYALPAASMVLFFSFSSSLASLLIVFHQEFGVSIGPKLSLLPYFCFFVIVQKHASVMPFFWKLGFVA